MGAFFFVPFFFLLFCGPNHSGWVCASQSLFQLTCDFRGYWIPYSTKTERSILLRREMPDGEVGAERSLPCCRQIRLLYCTVGTCRYGKLYCTRVHTVHSTPKRPGRRKRQPAPNAGSRITHIWGAFYPRIDCRPDATDTGSPSGLITYRVMNIVL